MQIIRYFLVFFLGLIFCDLYAQTFSQSFELRYFSPDTKANGETDFKGETAFFDTDQRIEYLEEYARIAKKFFNDPQLNSQVVPDSQLQKALKQLKPQPQPQVRNRLNLDQWKWLGHHQGQTGEEKEALDWWNGHSFASVRNGRLQFSQAGEISLPVVPQDWRFFIEWKLVGAAEGSVFTLKNEDGPVAGITFKGKNLFIETSSDEIRYPVSVEEIKVKLELDLENSRYNVYFNDQLIADFVTLINCHQVNQLIIKGNSGLEIDEIYGVGYQKAEYTEDIHTRDIPYSINTFIDQDFEIKPEVAGWQNPDYDDSDWENTQLPHSHGGERYADENLYLRTTITPESFQRANLVFETLDPGGEIWVNGEIVTLQNNRHPGEVDISTYLEPGRENLIAVKVYPNKVEHTNRHTVADRHTGWFAGRMHIDFTQKKYIQDLFTFTRSLEPAKQEIRIKLTNEDWEFEENEMKKTREFSGQLQLEFYPWYPEESREPVASKIIPVYLRHMKQEELITEVTVPEPELWSPERPFLYKVVATLKNQDNQPVDDYVITTGIRTISQADGTFRINGKPAMMNGALLFGYKSPLDKIAQWLRAGPEDWLVKEILMIKNMNANTIRMSIHHGMKGGVNDPRMAEIGDQLGVMFQWTTGTWVRTGSPWLLDFEGLPKYVRQVRNHPSIVMWQPGNHPKFVDFDTETIPWYQQVYQKIYPNDPSRLINPAANNTRLMGRNDEGTLDRKGNQVEPEPIWTAPMITRGDMDHATGYGTEWSTLRMYPFPPEWSGEQGWRSAGYRTDYLNSTERAYFDFESEESAGQPNWTLRKGKPSYQIKSYELKYDVGSIGRQLTVNEWELSQAWQAFSGFEAYKKKRWLDYDGLAWCPLHGGGNTATYQKPLIDYYGYAKLGYHAIKMAFQPTLAGSNNVDLVYGPDDQVTPIVVHLGDKKRVNLQVVIEDTNGKTLATKNYKNVQLAAGRSSQELEPIKPELKEGFFVVKYVIEEN